MFVCYDLITVYVFFTYTYYHEPENTYFFVYFSLCILYYVLLQSSIIVHVHLCANDMRLINATCFLACLFARIHRLQTYWTEAARGDSFGHTRSQGKV